MLRNWARTRTEIALILLVIVLIQVLVPILEEK
jgi:hypothetical protein